MADNYSKSEDIAHPDLTDCVERDDIADVAAREREIARVEQRARFGELAAGLAHEIKNPLAGIQGAVDIMLGWRASDDPERAILEGVRREVERIDRTVQLLLDRARPRVARTRLASVDDVVARAVKVAGASLTPERQKQVRLEMNPVPGPIKLQVDAVQIEDAVLNLILNGIDAIDGAGTVTVSIFESSGESRVDEIVIEVSDSGRGIPQTDLQRIFSPFYTTHPVGTGLGLPAVRGVARAHGGRVEVSSVVGVGSTFSLCLPRTNAAE